MEVARKFRDEAIKKKAKGVRRLFRMNLVPVHWKGYHEVSFTIIEALFRDTEHLAMRIKRMIDEGVEQGKARK